MYLLPCLLSPLFFRALSHTSPHTKQKPPPQIIHIYMFFCRVPCFSILHTSAAAVPPYVPPRFRAAWLSAAVPRAPRAPFRVSWCGIPPPQPIPNAPPCRRLCFIFSKLNKERRRFPNISHFPQSRLQNVPFCLLCDRRRNLHTLVWYFVPFRIFQTFFAPRVPLSWSPLYLITNRVRFRRIAMPPPRA